VKCKWCNKEFASERTVAAHMCVKKRRWADKDMSHIRLGHRVFQMFYEMNTSATKSKTIEDFIMSQYYEAFVKFGRACQVNNWLEPEKYTEYLIKNGVKLKQWASDKNYEKYLKEYVKKEPGLRALERTIMYFADWSAETQEGWQDYFKTVATPRAVYDIKSGKVSPWTIYMSDSGDQLLTRLNDEQINMINDIIDPPFWMKLFTTNKDEVSEIQEFCKGANL